MNIPLDNIVSVSDIQKNYRKIFDKAKKTKQPIMVMKDNEPEVMVVDVKSHEDMRKRLEEFEIEDALRAIEEGEREYKEGKTIKAKSMADLLK
jgi:PHD/YefM family antitoxin component YafN of YafNO toxin-antitoxin module